MIDASRPLDNVLVRAKTALEMLRLLPHEGLKITQGNSGQESSSRNSLILRNLLTSHNSGSRIFAATRIPPSPPQPPRHLKTAKNLGTQQETELGLG
jgi:hypothetical protein